VVSDHFDGQRFFNPTGAAGQPFTEVPRMLREPRRSWPRRVEVAVRTPPPLGDAAAVVTFVGHSTFLIQTPAGNLLTDPMFSRRAGPFGLLGPRRVRRPAIRFEELPPIGTVLLSHNHYDHCDLPTLRKLARRFDPLVLTPLGNARLVRSAGIRRVEELDWWDQESIGSLSIAMTPAQHFSARTPFDRNRALWAGFVVRFGDHRIYFAGDTAYAGFFRDIRQRFGPFDLALLPIGAYEPRWFMRVVHMNPAEAVQAHLDLGSPETIGMHFGTFRLTAEAIDDPIRELDQARQANGVPASRFRVLDFGGSTHITER
jgi:L-ascorbate metabolism protein UlaG (beta-lactamase superfamily)